MKNHNLSTIFIFVLVVTAFIGIVCISVTSCIFAFKLTNGIDVVLKNSKNSLPSAATDVLLTAGIGMMGILLAIRATFDITNILSRRDVEKLNSDIVSANSIIQNIDNSNKKYQQIQRDLFFVETSRNNWDPILCQIISVFPASNKSNETNGNQWASVPFASLTIIELKYTQVRGAHKSNYIYDKNLITISDEGISLINSVINENNELPAYVLEYLNYRKSGFNFFAGYCEQTKTEGVNRFLAAARGYESLSNVNGNTEYRCHLSNSIGECYSKIIQYYTLDEYVKYAFREKSFIMFSKTAIDKLKTATDETLDSHTKSVFYRNLGAAYERSASLEGDVSLYFAEAITAYKQSLDNAKAEDPADSKTVKAAYLAYLSCAANYLSSTSGTHYDDDQLRVLATLNTFSEEAIDYFPLSYNFIALRELTLLLTWKAAGQENKTIDPAIITQIESLENKRRVLPESQHERIVPLIDHIKSLYQELTKNSEEKPVSEA